MSFPPSFPPRGCEGSIPSNPSLDKINAANKTRREKRRAILREKNNRLMSQYEDLR